MSTSLPGPTAIQAVAIRVCRLDQYGNPILHSATGAYANSSFSKLEAAAQVENGDQFTQKTGGGVIFINYRDCDQVKWWDLTLEILYPDPELMELLLNGSLLVSGEDTLGFQYPKLAGVGCPNPVSVELWTKLIQGNTQPQDYPFTRWLLPFCHFRPATQMFENAPETFTFTGWAMENPNFGEGPFDDWNTAEGAPFNISSVTTANSSPDVTVASGGFPGVLSGMAVTGTGIPGSTTVVSVSGNTCVLSADATASGTVTLTFGSSGTAYDSTRAMQWIYSTHVPGALAPGYLAVP